MEEIKILLYVLGTFFGMEKGNIYAEHTSVSIDPNEKNIVITQNDLFAMIPSESDRIEALATCDAIFKPTDAKTQWANELNKFLSKNLNIESREKKEVILSMKYTDFDDLQALGIWFDVESKQFSINQIPSHHISTSDGKLIDNYWVFEGNKTFTFRMQPFLDMPESARQFRIPIERLCAK